MNVPTDLVDSDSFIDGLSEHSENCIKVLLAMMRYIEADRNCWPPCTNIMTATGLSERAVNRSFNEISTRWVVRTQNGDEPPTWSVRRAERSFHLPNDFVISDDGKIGPMAQLTRAACKVFVTMMRYVEMDSNCWPPFTRILKSTLLQSDRAIVRALFELERYGLVVHNEDSETWSVQRVFLASEEN